VILWLWTALASAAALIPTYTNRGNALVPIALAGLALLLFTYFHPGRVDGDQELSDDGLTAGRADTSPDTSPDTRPDEEVVQLEDPRRVRDSAGSAKAPTESH
jgi:hypothetical protein